MSKYEEKINGIAVTVARIDERTVEMKDHLKILNNRVSIAEKDIAEIKTAESGKLKIPLKVWVILVVILLGGTGGSSALVTKIMELW